MYSHYDFLILITNIETKCIKLWKKCSYSYRIFILRQDISIRSEHNIIKSFKNGEFQATFTRARWYHDWPSHHMHRRRDDIYILYNIHVSSCLYTPVCISWNIYIFLQKVSSNVYKYSTVIFTINEHVRRTYSTQHVQPNKMFVRHLSVENNHSGIVT